MCGLSGYIGESKKPILTYQLITKLFEKSESRGIDAAGFWGTESGLNGRVLYHKEPGRSSSFVKKDMWKQIPQYNPNLLLVHSRGASKGVGEPYDNKNNHPFTSCDKSIGLIHNGRVDEYQILKQKYELNSNCDSEILLRIFESGVNYSAEQLANDFGDNNLSHRLAGIRDIFSIINEGHMAVAVGERLIDGSRLLWLFRNRHRPLWVVDLRDALGQVFFISEPNIWEDAVRECSNVKLIARSQKLIELPIEEIWYFKVTLKETSPETVNRYKVCKDNMLALWNFDGKKIQQPKYKDAKFDIITNLGEKDRVLNKNIKNEVVKLDLVERNNFQEELSFKNLKIICKEIIDRVINLQIIAENLIQEQNITKQDFDQLLLDLDQQSQSLQDINLTLEK